MNDKTSNKSGKNIIQRLAAPGRKKALKRRIYIEKHSAVMRYLYDTDESQINDMIETLKRFALKENS